MRRAVVPLCALSLLTGAVATGWIMRVGHAGAKAVWSENGREGNERGERGGGD
jgi:hypothetical protein